MTKLEPLIIWQKWRDPFGRDVESDDLPPNDEDIYGDAPYILDNLKGQFSIPTMKTGIGIIPLVDSTNPAEISNFWTMHANFPLTKKIAHDIGEVPGVETLLIQTRYRCRIGIGKAFGPQSVKQAIQQICGVKTCT